MMQYRPLGQSGLSASVIGLGTWAIGGWMWGGTDETTAIAAIQASLDAGINLLDTAPAYGFGLAEEIVGKAIAGRRDKVLLATKCGLRWDITAGQFFFATDDAGRQVSRGRPTRRLHRYLAPTSIRHELEDSLRRLHCEAIDLYQTHWQDPTTPIEDTMGVLLDLKAEGKIRAIGVCNAQVAQLDRYRRLGPVDADQEKFSLLDRQLAKEQLPYCQTHNMAVLAYSPLALGLLTGKIGPDRQWPPGDQRATHPRFSRENLLRVQGFHDKLQPIARAHRSTLAQVVIAWTLVQPGLTHALVGARSPEQAVENAAAGDLKLTGAELDAIKGEIARHFKNGV